MRKKILVGNWKMNMLRADTKSLLEMVKASVNTDVVDLAFCPAFTSLDVAVNVLGDTDIKVGAQNTATEEAGAYTGEISVSMLKDIGAEYVIIGHSERRSYYFETDEVVNKKAKIVMENSLIPIICVGESLSQRKENKHIEVIEKQVKKALADLDVLKIEEILIAYEPVWAIGTGETATPEQAEEICSYIRYFIAELYGVSVSEKVRILYGGSVNSSNVVEILSSVNIDGALVGGASLKPEFVEMIRKIEEM